MQKKFDDVIRVSVKKSDIHGKGLFAAETIKKGDVIGYFKTKKAKKTNGPYILWMENENPVEVTCDLKYINHNKKPNAIYYDDFSVVALKRIPKNTEITHDYGKDWK